MKTKQKKDESKLYDFDYESKEEKKLKAKRKKAVKKSASKEAKKEANGKHGQVPEKKRYEDEIIIGVTRYPEKKQTNNQKSTKKFNKKPQKRRKNEENREKYNVGQINKKSKITLSKVSLALICAFLIAIPAEPAVFLAFSPAAFLSMKKLIN